MQTTTNIITPAPVTDDKDQIISLLDKWISQRPGLEYANYGDLTSYRSEQRAIARDGRDAHALLGYVAQRRHITADKLREGFSAYSGRLSLGTDSKGAMCLDYCTGQYWPTEYRKAACAVLASVVWNYTRDDAMAPADSWRVQQWSRLGSGATEHAACGTREGARRLLRDLGGREYGCITELYRGLSAYDFILRAARLEFGRAIAARWFS